MSLPDRSAAPAGPIPSGMCRADVISGFLVFLIAMPLCLAIARASNFPPIAGIWTAVAGGLIASFISNSQLTIKGPAAGLIVIVAGAVTEFAAEFGQGLSEHDALFLGYRMALGVGVVSGLIQILFGFVRAGKLGEFFSLSAIHGMLASIGIIIIAKQVFLVLGVDTPKDKGPLELLLEIPHAIQKANPEIAAIGLVSLLLLFGIPLIRNRYVRKIPVPMLVLLLAIPLGMAFDLEHKHTYLVPHNFYDSDHPDQYEVGPRFLVDMPEVLKDPSTAFAFPIFTGLLSGVGIKYIILFSLIGSLESMLTAKAIDLMDPWKRKTNMNRDLLGVGIANTAVAFMGGLPMISEVVRSSANKNNGARTRWANWWHALFLLGFVLLLPNLIHRIPLAALGAMLVYTGFRLASPREFVKTYQIGFEQLVIFLATIISTLLTDLLIGIATGILVEICFLIIYRTPLRTLFRPDVESMLLDETTTLLIVKHAAVFSHWISLKGRIEEFETKHVVVDMSQTHIVDHSTMKKMHALSMDFEIVGRSLTVRGLEMHIPVSDHPFAARTKKYTGNERVITI